MSKHAEPLNWKYIISYAEFDAYDMWKDIRKTRLHVFDADDMWKDIWKHITKTPIQIYWKVYIQKKETFR